jgi:hypothetical protein
MNELAGRKLDSRADHAEMAVPTMYLNDEMVREHQHVMLTAATEQRQGLRLRALERARRRAQRAKRQLAYAQQAADRLESELTAEQES